MCCWHVTPQSPLSPKPLITGQAGDIGSCQLSLIPNKSPKFRAGAASCPPDFTGDTVCCWTPLLFNTETRDVPAQHQLRRNHGEWAFVKKACSPRTWAHTQLYNVWIESWIEMWKGYNNPSLTECYFMNCYGPMKGPP